MTKQQSKEWYPATKERVYLGVQLKISSCPDGSWEVLVNEPDGSKCKIAAGTYEHCSMLYDVVHKVFNVIT